MDMGASPSIESKSSLSVAKGSLARIGEGHFRTSSGARMVYIAHRIFVRIAGKAARVYRGDPAADVSRLPV